MNAARLSLLVVSLSALAVWGTGTVAGCLSRPVPLGQIAGPVDARASAGRQPAPLQELVVRAFAERARPAPARPRRNLFREPERAVSRPPGSLSRLSARSPGDSGPGAAGYPGSEDPGLRAPGPRISLAGLAEHVVSGVLVRTAVLSGPGDVWIVREGDLVAGRYRVESVESDSVRLADTLGGPPQVLRFR